MKASKTPCEASFIWIHFMLLITTDMQWHVHLQFPLLVLEVIVPVIVSSFLITYFIATIPVTLKVNKLDTFLLLHSGNMQLRVMVLPQHINGAVVNICKYSNKAKC